jgi:hypothetical protein
MLNTILVKADSEVSREPDIVFGGDNYLVVWSDGTFGGEYKVQAARVNPDGAVLDSGVVFGMGAYCEYRPAVAFDGQRYFAVWYNYNHNPAGLFGRFINSECQPEDHEFVIRVLSEDALLDPDIAFGDSSYLVVWNEPSPYYDDDVYGQLVSVDGDLIGGAIAIANDSSYQYGARVCAGDTLYLVVWNQDCAIFGQWVSMLGELVGSNFRISDTVSCTRDFPSLAIGNDESLVAWHQFCGGNYDIFGNLDIQLGVEQTPGFWQDNEFFSATIISGPLHLPAGKKCDVYDITGRQIDVLHIQPGIYFIELDGKIVHKVVKVR